MGHQPKYGISIRALIPNMVTAMALCTGLSAIWFALSARWPEAVMAIVAAGVLDGIDGRIARLLKGQSRFGAELDSLSDNIAFGVSPAIVLFIWSLQYMPRFGWTIALFYTLCMALRLARFNAQIDVEHQPHKSAGFLTGVPAPTAAGLALLPLVIWLETGFDIAQEQWIVGPWMLFVALLAISSVATFSWSSLRIRRSVRMGTIAVAGMLVTILITAPWVALIILCIGYLILIPFSMISYGRTKKRIGIAANN
ncbi:CDP-diacylglycerol O-phosphatidyltransferase [Sphingorhabdus lutea]|uniref:CDP-diacylglycerol O-phosphatidyltransferase n=2 Tax=Sphingorhabdus lutea TaxID=1913578 RepID=A0A1L3JF16_9SPHN|nr:CDP-diacylglycerol O-phosphatidyltransferase [Sphingorhabdus lutea]